MTSEPVPKPKIARHKTAIKRQSYSLPVKCMLRDGLLDEATTVFDYGCGHGQDLELLAAEGVSCSGWDPVHRPHGQKGEAQVVNLGYVINVIEDVNERRDVVMKAWSLCERMLTVAAQIEFAAPDKVQEQHGDGVLTTRGTFQKYFNQYELREYLESILGTDAISAAPGVFYLFKDEEAKQQFVANKYHRRLSVPRRKVSEVLFEQHKAILEPLMEALTRYGRIPGKEELPEAAEITESLGSLKRAFKLIQKVTDDEPWTEIAERRKEDLLVYLALARFKERPKVSQLPLSVQRDIKSFLGSYRNAVQQADQLLFSAGDSKVINDACVRAPVGQLVDNALTVHESALDYLEPVLRIYEGCARALVGQIDEANLIKIHRSSGKVSYIAYPEFEKSPHPQLTLRVKVSLRSLRIDYFDYSEWDDPPILFRKDEFLHDDHPKRNLFAKLSRQEDRLGILPMADARCSRRAFESIIQETGMALKGHQLRKS
jgi:DNA phosphorothioation-associated putative methyltransferase